MASVPVGTLYDGTHVDTNSTVLSTQLDYVSTFSTNSTTDASFEHGSTFATSIVSSDTILLAIRTSIHFTIPTSISRHHASTHSVQLRQQ